MHNQASSTGDDLVERSFMMFLMGLARTFFVSVASTAIDSHVTGKKLIEEVI